MTHRKLTNHKVPGLNEALEITVLDEPGEGGACHEYEIRLLGDDGGVVRSWDINFQNGPVACPEDFNGLTNEVLLAILIDRMEGFQSGPFACLANANALSFACAALRELKHRTQDRIARDVEGRNEP